MVTRFTPAAFPSARSFAASRSACMERPKVGRSAGIAPGGSLGVSFPFFFAEMLLVPHADPTRHRYECHGSRR
eukprot:3953331-Prymnesium_polylepis.1